ncbi:hypothetical protein [Streptomyces sp. NPDC058280]|uniref:hypothetical protein n=1 Tax=Streptomyces sp. NPDC058280 TaxID=3346419 RepID=UPI0036EDAF35
MIIEFTIPAPCFISDVRDYGAILEAKLRHQTFLQKMMGKCGEGQSILNFTLRVGLTRYIGKYLACSNAPTEVHPEDLHIPNEAMRRLAEGIRSEKRK